MIARAVFDLGLSYSARRRVSRSENNDRDRTSDRHSVTLSQEIPGGVDLSLTGTAIQDDIANTQQGDISLTLSKVLLGFSFFRYSSTSI